MLLLDRRDAGEGVQRAWKTNEREALGNCLNQNFAGISHTEIGAGMGSGLRLAAAHAANGAEGDELAGL